MGVLGEKAPLDVTKQLTSEVRGNQLVMPAMRLPAQPAIGRIEQAYVVHYSLGGDPRVHIFERQEGLKLGE